MIHRASHLLIVLVCLALVIPSLSCAAGQSPVNKKLELKLEKAPRLNEPVALSCLRTVNIYGGSDNISVKTFLTLYRIDPKTRHVIEVAPQDVLAKDSLNFETAASRGVPLKFSATIRFPAEGNWSICARPSLEAGDSDCVYLYVAEDSSTFGWLKDYAPYVGSYPDTTSEQHPITVELDILKPPRLNEPFQITWGISTIRDIPEASGGVRFIHMEGTKEISIPVEEVLIKGDVTWKGSLKKGSPLRFSATVKLPEEGDWAVGSYCNSYVEREPINAGSALYMHVEKDKGRWGWTESHENPYKGPPPPEVELPQRR